MQFFPHEALLEMRKVEADSIRSIGRQPGATVDAPICKDCFAVHARDWYSKNRDHAVERARKWQQDNPERVRAYRKQRNALNREQIREGHLRRKFGLTLDGYAELLARQGGGCRDLWRARGHVVTSRRP